MKEKSKIDLVYSSGFAWLQKGGIYVRGYLFDKNNQLYENENLILFFQEIKTINQLKIRLLEANGLFNVIINKGGFFAAATDKIRSLPLFYRQRTGSFRISDSMEGFVKNCSYNPTNAAEFLATGYVTNKYTLLSCVFQIQAAELIYLKDEQVQTQSYFKYVSSSNFTENYNLLKTRLITTIEGVFQRLINSLQGRTAVVPLSGGYDSRLILLMLKKLGYQKIIAYTYGRADNAEMKIAEKLCKKLHVKWIKIEYTEELIANYLNDNDFQAYYPFAAQYTSMFFMEQFFALRFLKKKNLIPEKSVFIPGFSGDMIAGSKLSELFLAEIDHDKLCKEIYKKHYQLIEPQSYIKNNFLSDINNLGACYHIPYYKSHSIFEEWNIQNRQAKFIVNSTAVYRFFDYPFRLPFWDNELIDFFKHLPLEFKLHKKLYDDVLVNSFFKEAKINFSKELQTSRQTIRNQQFKEKIKPFLPRFVVRAFQKKDDPIFYREITKLMIDDMKKSGFNYKNTGNNYNAVIVQWYIQKVMNSEQIIW